jgi:hypothetical protein
LAPADSSARIVANRVLILSDYRRALEDLFREATPEEPAEHSRRFVVAGAFVLFAFLCVGATALLWRLVQ